MEPIPSLNTERLILRKIEVTDAPFFYTLFNSEGWLKYIGDRNIKTVEDAKKQLAEKYIPSYTDNGYGSYVVVEKKSGNLIGTCGIYKRDNLEHPDIGFAFLPEFTGRGYALESAQAILKYAIEHNGIKKILAITIPENEPSIRLLKKLKLQQTGNYKDQQTGTSLLLFSKSLLI